MGRYYIITKCQNIALFFTGVRKIQRTKFNVDKDKSKRTYNGIVFDSILEMKYYRDYILPRVESGDIADVKLQVKYELQPKFIHDNKTVQPINYVADFVVTYSNGNIEVIDTKGCPDSTAILKRKLFWYVYPDLVYRWICYSKIDGGWVEYERVKQQRAIRKRNKS